jgi:hypothetical protein
MFMVPNDKGKLGRWRRIEFNGPHGCGDFAFIQETTARHGAGSLVWRDELISHVRYHFGK